MVEIPEELRDILVSTPDTLSGAVRFAGTRVHVQVFLDTIADGWSLDRTLQSLPSIPRDAARRVLQWQNAQSQRAMGIELV